jgi:hypothetical protein
VHAYEIHLFVLQGMQIDCLTLNARAELNEYEAEGHGQRVSLLDKIVSGGSNGVEKG